MLFLGGGRSRSENIAPEPLNPQQAVLHVEPLSSVPYIGPPTPHSYTASSPTKRHSETVEKVGPAMIFLPSLSTQEEWNSVVAATKVGVALTGSAAMGKIGPVIGLMDIGESVDSYFFRVSLPGVTSDEKDFNCDVEPDGKIVIKGVTTTGEKLCARTPKSFRCKHKIYAHAGTSLSHSSCQVQWTTNNFLVLSELMGFWKVL